MNRTTITTVTFRKPFLLPGLDGPLPAGSYSIETEEELIQGLSFEAWRRVWMSIRLPRAQGSTTEEVATIDPAVLDAALLQDGAAD